MALHAILIAGGMLPRGMRKLSASRVKALLEMGSETLLETSAKAARESGLFTRIAAVGNGEVQAACPEGCEYVVWGDDMMGNIENAYRAFGEADHDYVIISPDLPFITADGLRNFTQAAQATCEIGISIVSEDEFLARFPGSPNKFEQLDGKPATMGSVFYITGPALRSNIALLRDMYASRKRPWRLAIFLGFPVLWGFITKRLTTAMLAARFSSLMGADFKGIAGSDPGLIFDIDTLENYEFAVKLLGEGNTGQ